MAKYKYMPKQKKLTIQDLIDKVKKYDPKADLDMIQLAYDFAKTAHGDQKRKSGEPYIIHPLETAHILADLRIDPTIIVAALLHDVPEDTAVTLEEIEHNFNSDTASMIKGITKLGKLKYRGVERYIENIRKMFFAMAEDVRVMIIKFADRIHNLSTLEALPPQKRYRIALESLEIYAPIAGRLGMDEFKGRLEDLSFKYVYPKEYERIKKIRDEKLKGKTDLIEEVKKNTKENLKNAGLKIISIRGRKKRLYSLYKKLEKKNNDTTKIYDLVALRIITKTIADCYATLGIIHTIWKPLKGRIKDYISQPKPNGYQSLHTTVFTEGGEIVEFQIRTKDMHEDAEFGVAAHWHYDENGNKKAAKKIQWVKELADIQKGILTKLSDLEEIKVDFLQSRIFVFTPKGDVIDLPEGATPVDFAYHIHTDIGNKCMSAIINEQINNLGTELKNGDVVEIIIDKKRKGPNRDWLNFVKTHTAKQHIKNFAKEQEQNTIKGWFKNVITKK